MAKLKIQKTANGITVDSFVSNIQINGSRIGGTGGDTDQTVPTIRISFLRATGAALDTGYIIAQKGSQKFQVNNSSDANTTVVSLVNRQASELTAANTATIVANTMVITGANLANIGTGSGSFTNNRTFAYITYATANVAGNSSPGIGYQFTGNSGFLTGNVTVVAINSTTNVTVSCTDQTVTANTTGRLQVTNQFNVKRISNKYVLDWANEKWRYYLGQPFSSGAAILSSQPEWQNVILVRVDNA